MKDGVYAVQSLEKRRCITNIEAMNLDVVQASDVLRPTSGEVVNNSN